jgi:hypothetical protein
MEGILLTGDLLIAEATPYTNTHTHTKHNRQTNKHALSRIQTHDSINQAAADPSHRHE